MRFIARTSPFQHAYALLKRYCLLTLRRRAPLPSPISLRGTDERTLSWWDFVSPKAVVSSDASTTVWLRRTCHERCFMRDKQNSTFPMLAAQYNL